VTDILLTEFIILSISIVFHQLFFLLVSHKNFLNDLRTLIKIKGIILIYKPIKDKNLQLNLIHPKASLLTNKLLHIFLNESLNNFRCVFHL
jgi:hypothetical protein